MLLGITFHIFGIRKSMKKKNRIGAKGSLKRRWVANKRLCSAGRTRGTAGFTQWCSWRQDQVRVLLDCGDKYGKLWHRLFMREEVQPPINAWCDTHRPLFLRTTDLLYWHLARSRVCFIQAVALMERRQLCPRCFGTPEDDETVNIFTLVIPPPPWQNPVVPSLWYNYDEELHRWRSLVYEWA